VFVGHYSAAFLARGLAGRAPLWTLLLAAQLVDVLWAVFVLAGVERVRLDPSLPSNPLVLEHMPWTHSLLGTMLWAGLAFAAARRWLGPARIAAAVAAVVASHWFLDLVVHRPDLTLFGQPPKLGFALWNHPLAAFATEIALLAASVWFCVRRETGAGRAGRARRVVALGALLALVQASLLVTPLPTAVPALVISTLAFFLVVAWAGRRVERPAPA
jgi:hypothetical protein